MSKSKDRIGFTSVVGDLLHAGHIVMLQEAAQQCDYLIVGLLINPRLDRPDKNAPIQSVLERFIQLTALECVDEVIPLEGEQDLVDCIKLLQPDIRICGAEYEGKKHTGYELCPHYYNKREHSFSSTELRKRIMK